MARYESLASLINAYANGTLTPKDHLFIDNDSSGGFEIHPALLLEEALTLLRNPMGACIND